MLSLQQTKKMLQELTDNWNPKYWIFSADGDLHLMRYKKDGLQGMNDDDGVDQKYISGTFHIPSDGGDW